MIIMIIIKMEDTILPAALTTVALRTIYKK